MKKDLDIQPRFEPGSSDFQSDVLTNWTTGEALGIGSENKHHLFIDTVWLSSNHQTAAATFVCAIYIDGLATFFFWSKAKQSVSVMAKKKDIETQARIWTWVFWILVRCSYHLNCWSSWRWSGEQMAFIHRHSFILRMDLSQAWYWTL